MATAAKRLELRIAELDRQGGEPGKPGSQAPGFGQGDTTEQRCIQPETPAAMVAWVLAAPPDAYVSELSILAAPRGTDQTHAGCKQQREQQRRYTDLELRGRPRTRRCWSPEAPDGLGRHQRWPRLSFNPRVHCWAARRTLGTTLGPHGMHATEQPARRHTQRSPCTAGLTWTDAKPHFLGVKGSPVQIRPSRLIVELFRTYFYPTRANKRAIRVRNGPSRGVR